VHVNFIDRTDDTVEGEDEFLFSPYSVFTVRQVMWRPKAVATTYQMQPHIIDVDVASDNSKEDCDIVAPWC